MIKLPDLMQFQVAAEMEIYFYCFGNLAAFREFFYHPKFFFV